MTTSSYPQTPNLKVFRFQLKLSAGVSKCFAFENTTGVLDRTVNRSLLKPWLTWCLRYSPQILKWHLVSNYEAVKGRGMKIKMFLRQSVDITRCGLLLAWKQVSNKYRYHFHHFSEGCVPQRMHFTVWVGSGLLHKGTHLQHLKLPKRQVSGLKL